MIDGDGKTSNDRPRGRKVNRDEAGCVDFLMSARKPGRGSVEPSPSLLGTGLVAFAAFGALLIWHIVRRGRLIRERLSAPRVVRLPEFPTQEIDQPS